MRDWLTTFAILLTMVLLGMAYVIAWSAILGSPETIPQLVAMMVPAAAAALIFFICWAIKHTDTR